MTRKEIERLRTDYVMKRAFESELAKCDDKARREKIKGIIKDITLTIRQKLREDVIDVELLNGACPYVTDRITCREWVTDPEDIEWLENTSKAEQHKWLEENNPNPYVWREYSPTGQRYRAWQRFVKYPNRGWAYIYDECVDV